MSVSIPINGHALQSDLTISPDSKGLVIFAHGSGSSRHSPRNRHVAQILNTGGLATLLVDLLSPAEELVDNRTAEHRFNIDLLAERLVIITDWARRQQSLSPIPLGYFGASTGAAAALVAAGERPHIVEAVVSRGGRPDLAGSALSRVAAPTLFIVGEFDRQVLDLNHEAAQMIPAPTHLEVVPRAGHLFEEPGALDQVAMLARDWFERMLIRKHAA